MNVYVRELSSALARAGVACDVFTRAWSDDLAPGGRHRAGPAGPPRPRRAAEAHGQGVAPGRGRRVRRRGAQVDGRRAVPTAARTTLPFDAVHANYWLSGSPATCIKHELNLPLVSTFHTLDRVKAEARPEEVEADSPTAGPRPRRPSSAAPTPCWPPARSRPTRSPRSTAADPRASASSPPASTTPSSAPATGPRPAGPSGCPPTARCCSSSAASSRSRAPTSPSRPWPSLGAGPARRPPGRRRRPERAPRGRGVGRIAALVADAPASSGTCDFVPPQPHELLSTYYRAADVCLVPSRSESFGLVALEAAACGTPVVASAVGGLSTLVDHGRTGFLVEDADPEAYAAWVRRIFAEPLLGRAAVHRLGAAGPPLHLGARRPPAGRDARRAGRRPPRRVPLTDRAGPWRPRAPPRRGAGCCARIDAWAARELAAGGALVAAERQAAATAPALPLVPPLQGEEKDFVTVWLTLAPAHAPPRGAVHARARDQHGGDLGVPAAAQRRAARHVLRPRRRGRRLPGGPGAGRGSTTTSWTASSGRRSPTPTSTSRRP